MNTQLIIIGGGGQGKVCSDIAVKMSKWADIAVLDDDASLKHCLSFDVIGGLPDVQKHKETADVFVALGNNKMREHILADLIANGFSVATLIHPSAIIGTNVEIDIGTVVMAGVVINSCNRIGKGCIINTCSSLDHDNLIEDYVHVSPGVHTAGRVKIGQSSTLGIGTVVGNNVSISRDASIGAGAVVIKDISEPGTYVGLPARKIY